MRLSFESGQFDDLPAQSRRTLGEIASIFVDQEAASSANPDQVLYETFGCPGEVRGEPRLLYATTVLQSGRVGDEFFMTRGHFHTNPDRGELMLTLKGKGALILMDREGKSTMESMSPGSMHDIDGRLAHRVANTGSEPLIFYVAWMSDCGHDYAAIEKSGFSKVLLARPEGPELVDR